MYEVELKIRADHGPVRERLVERGAEQVRTVRQVDTYFDAPHRDFAETNEALRVRRETGHGDPETRITYKGSLVEAESKTREEVETVVVDGNAARKLFERLGFTPAATVEKDREVYTYEGYTVTLDDVAGLGEFIEVETESNEVEPAREGARALLTDLEFDPDDHVRTSYLGLLLTEERGRTDTGNAQ